MKIVLINVVLVEYIVLTIVVFTIFSGITIYFVYYNWSLIKNNVSCIKFNTRKKKKRFSERKHINVKNKTNRY